MKLLLGLFFVAFCQGHFTRPPSYAKNGRNEVTDNTCPSGCSCSFYESTKKLRTIECSTKSGSQDYCSSVFDQPLVAFTHLQSLSIEGCDTLTNYSSLPYSPKMTYLKLSQCGLQWIIQDADGDTADNETEVISPHYSQLEHLDLSYNRIDRLPTSTFIKSFEYLKFLDLSGNLFKTFDVSLLSISIQEFHLDFSSQLHSLDQTETYLKDQLQVFSAKSNGNLRHFCPWIIWSQKSLQELDLSENPELRLPHRIFKANEELRQVSIDSVICDCSPPQDILETCEFNGTNYHLSNFRLNFCQLIPSEDTNSSSIEVQIFQNIDLENQNKEGQYGLWITPLGKVYTLENSINCSKNNEIIEERCLSKMSRIFLENDKVNMASNGSLEIGDLGWSDRGTYEYLSYNDLVVFQSTDIDIVLDLTYRQSLYYVSLIYGFATAGGFLLITLFLKLIHFILHNYGCCLFCCCCKDQLPPKAKRLKSALESIEAYRGQQLDKLRENYAEQNEWIRQNCAVQMERVRENYNYQVQNLRDIRHYGSHQVGAVRDQYFEQMARIRDYSSSQLERLHENYVFQRQRLGKFNAQNYLKMRETRQYTRRTLQKVMESLPALYLDLTTCRQGLGERAGSIEWDPTIQIDPSQILELERYHQKRMQQFAERSESLYFTPSGTPIREIEPDFSGVSGGAVGGGSGGLIKNSPYNDSDAYKAVYGSVGNNANSHSRVKSFSHYLPGWFNKEVTVEVIVEQTKHQDSDQEDEEKVSEESDELLHSTKIESSEEMTEMSSSIESSTSKKVMILKPKKESSSSSGCSSKKTLMTNLSGMKSEIDLSAPFLPNVRRKSL